MVWFTFLSITELIKLEKQVGFDLLLNESRVISTKRKKFNVVGVENAVTTAGDFEVTNGFNLVTGGPFTIASGHTVTVGSGETWTVV